MVTTLNLDSLSVDSRGRVSFSGLGTGIDIQGTVDAIIKAKRIPIDRIEQRISEREARIAALTDLRSLALNLRTATQGLRGAITFDGSGDIFEAKEAFASTSRSDAQTPSAAADLIGVNVTNAADAASHTIEVKQVAAAHKVASAATAGALGDPLALSGTFEINGRQITIDAGHSLHDVRDRINAANTGANATGVRASIVSISSTQHVLILTADATGTDALIRASDVSGGVLHGLGVLDGSGAFQNELQAAQNAQISVDGLGTLIERQSNTVDDVFAGVTLSLFKAEPGTAIKLDVDRNLGAVKAAIAGFVDAYNELRTAINQQARTGVDEEDESTAGVLAGTSALSEIRARLAGAAGAAVDANDPAFAVLAQIGIKVRGASEVGDPLLANTLEINQTRLDEALLNETEAVRTLFTFGLSSANADVRLAGFDGNTRFSASGYKLNIAWSDGVIASANIDGAADGSDDGSVTVQGNLLSVVSGPARGLKVLYAGTSAVSGAQLDLSVGIGAKLFHEVDAIVRQSTGLIDSEIATLEDQNALGQRRVERLEERLERERERLLERFVAMEAALTSMNRLLDSLRQQIESIFDNDR